jgi:hypothetical protein
MNTNTTATTAAALRTYGVPSFVVSTGMSSWPTPASPHGAHGTLGTQLLPIGVPNPTADRDARVAAKQDRPPRGVPR